jgi:hypothetical protein
VTCPRWSLRVVLALSFLARVGSAQTGRISPSASVDLTALSTGEIRVSIEPASLGRTTLGLSLGRWWGGNTLGVTPVSEAFGGSGALPNPAREYMVDLYTRVYPKAFSVSSGLHLSGYLGAFLGFDERERDESSPCPEGFACPLGSGSNAICACPLIPATGSGAIACSCPPTPPAGTASEDRAYGIEPGVEFGVRAMPTEYLVLEVGTWARMITFPDPTGRFQEGQLDPRLTLSIGVCW